MPANKSVQNTVYAVFLTSKVFYIPMLMKRGALTAECAKRRVL
jgi:hypothetical protein